MNIWRWKKKGDYNENADDGRERAEITENKLNTGSSKNRKPVTDHTLEVRQRMHSELAKKIGGKPTLPIHENTSSQMSSSKSISIKSYQSHINITEKSNRDECKEFLISKEFSNK